MHVVYTYCGCTCTCGMHSVFRGGIFLVLRHLGVHVCVGDLLRRRSSGTTWSPVVRCQVQRTLSLVRSGKQLSSSFRIHTTHCSIMRPSGQPFSTAWSSYLSRPDDPVRLCEKWSGCAVRAYNPLLRNVAHSISTVAAPDSSEGGSTFSSLLNIETKTEDRLHSPGAKPSKRSRSTAYRWRRRKRW